MIICFKIKIGRNKSGLWLLYIQTSVLELLICKNNLLFDFMMNASHQLWTDLFYWCSYTKTRSRHHLPLPFIVFYFTKQFITLNLSQRHPWRELTEPWAYGSAIWRKKLGRWPPFWDTGGTPRSLPELWRSNEYGRNLHRILWEGCCWYAQNSLGNTWKHKIVMSLPSRGIYADAKS